MKIELGVLSFMLLLIPLHFSLAQIYTPPIGSQTNPIHIQVEQNSLTLWSDAWSKINSIEKIPYCSKVYDDVMAMAKKNGNGDISNPSVAKSEANYLNYLYNYYQTCIKAYSKSQNVVKTSEQSVVKTTNDVKLAEMFEIIDQGCKKLSGINSYYSGETDINNNGGMGGCGCKTGYKFTNGNYGECVSVNTVITPTVSQPISGGGVSNVNIVSEIQKKEEIKSDVKIEKDVDVSSSDIKIVNKKGVLTNSTALRSCQSDTCEIYRYYAETSELNIIEEYKNGEWYKIKGTTGAGGTGKLVTGWVIGSSFDKNSIVETGLPNLNSTTSPSESEPQVRKSFWQILKGWFGFGK